MNWRRVLADLMYRIGRPIGTRHRQNRCVTSSKDPTRCHPGSPPATNENL